VRISGKYSDSDGRDSGTQHVRTTINVTLNADGNLTVDWGNGYITTWYRSQ
jgi:hypothetical protein